MTGPARKNVAGEWVERAAHDWETAKQLAESDRFHPDVVGMLVQQAVEKYLKGYLISKGWELERTHDLERLCKIAAKHDKGFGGFVDGCIEIGEFYITGRYPPIAGEEVTGEEIESTMKSAEELVKFIIQRM